MRQQARPWLCFQLLRESSVGIRRLSTGLSGLGIREGEPPTAIFPRKYETRGNEF